ncbi:ATP-binding cassette sub-family A member 7-like [Amblyomma americanum]
MISGMGPLLYWLTNYAFDFMFYIGTAMMVLPPLAFIPHTQLTGSDIRLIFMLNLLHGYAALPMIYMCSFLFDSPTVGFSVIAISTFIVSSAGCVGWVFKEHYSDDIESAGLTTVLEVALQVLRLLPSQSYSRGMTKILQLAQENALCRRGGIELHSRCHAADAKAHLSLWECCLHADSADPYDYAIQPLDMHPYSAFYDLLTLSVEGVAVFALLLCVEYWLPRLDRNLSALEPSAYREGALYAPRPIHSPIGQGIAGPKKHEDTDVLREEGLVNGLVSGDAVVATDARPFVIVHGLYKAYGYTDTNSVLQGLSFTIRSGECFGLLGVNGAGKTTTFRVLTGQLLPHEGDAYVAGFSLVWNTAMFQRYVGYCPQRDGLLDMLTATETLLLFGRLKGVPMSAEYLSVLLDIFHLGEFAEQLVCTMSAGNRRKLSLCVAMMGVPRLLLLDEPYAGIGTTARKRIVSYMSALQRTTKFSILLSSHSMADVEFLCNRIAILGEGRLQCLGSLAHLKEKFGKGYTITVKTYPDRKQDFFYHKEVAADVTKNFKEAELVHSYEGQLEFRMSRVHMLWSEMFMRMAKIKKKFKLQDFFITDTSLEQIFLSVTRKEASEAAAAAAVQSPVGRTVALATTLGI